jgi:hypothetical protein
VGYSSAAISALARTVHSSETSQVSALLAVTKFLTLARSLSDLLTIQCTRLTSVSSERARGETPQRQLIELAHCRRAHHDGDVGQYLFTDENLRPSERVRTVFISSGVVFTLPSSRHPTALSSGGKVWLNARLKRNASATSCPRHLLTLKRVHF